MHAGFRSGDRQRLRKALRRVRRARPFRRLQALLWLAEGRSVSEVARLAHASRVSIYNWCAAYQQAGRGRKLASLLEEKPRSGRPRQIGPQAEAVLQAALAQSPLALHDQSPGWTLALLATHLQKCCGGPRREPRRAAPAPARLELALEAAPLRLSAARLSNGPKKTRDPEALGGVAGPGAPFAV